MYFTMMDEVIGSVTASLLGTGYQVMYTRNVHPWTVRTKINLHLWAQFYTWHKCLFHFSSLEYELVTKIFLWHHGRWQESLRFGKWFSGVCDVQDPNQLNSHSYPSSNIQPLTGKFNNPHSWYKHANDIISLWLGVSDTQICKYTKVSELWSLWIVMCAISVRNKNAHPWHPAVDCGSHVQQTVWLLAGW